MNEIILAALLKSVKDGRMTIEQVPLPYQAKINELLNPEL